MSRPMEAQLARPTRDNDKPTEDNVHVMEEDTDKNLEHRQLFDAYVADMVARQKRTHIFDDEAYKSLLACLQDPQRKKLKDRHGAAVAQISRTYSLEPPVFTGENVAPDEDGVVGGQSAVHAVTAAAAANAGAMSNTASATNSASAGSSTSATSASSTSASASTSAAAKPVFQQPPPVLALPVYVPPSTMPSFTSSLATSTALNSLSASAGVMATSSLSASASSSTGPTFPPMEGAAHTLFGTLSGPFPPFTQSSLPLLLLSTATPIYDKKTGKQLACSSMMFDILSTNHIKCKHAGAMRTFRAVEGKWCGIPRKIVSHFCALCPRCGAAAGASGYAFPNTPKGKRPSVDDDEIKAPNRKRARTFIISPRQEYFKLAFRLAKKAGAMMKLAMKQPGMQVIASKSHSSDLVTETDKKCEEVIISEIKRLHPNHKFIAEESHATGDKYDWTNEPTWLIDPVDGTTNFVHGFGHTCVSIALSINKEIVVAVVYDPIKDETFHAIKGEGAFLNETIPLHVSQQQKLNSAVVINEFGYERQIAGVDLMLGRLRRLLLNNVQAVRLCGSCALNLCYVAAGRAEAYFEGISSKQGPKPWDMAAGSLILSEAGGAIMDVNGAPLDMASGRLLACNNTHMAAQLINVITDKPLVPLVVPGPGPVLALNNNDKDKNEQKRDM